MTEVDGGTGEALPVATATKEESDRLREGQPAGSQVAGPGELLPGHSANEAKALTAPVRAEAAKAGVGGRIRRRIHKRVDGGDTDTPRHTADNGRPVMVPPQTLKLIRNLRTGELLPRRSGTNQARLRPHARSLCSPSGGSAGERAETVHPPATQRERGRLGPP